MLQTLYGIPKLPIPKIKCLPGGGGRGGKQHFAPGILSLVCKFGVLYIFDFLKQILCHTGHVKIDFILNFLTARSPDILIFLQVTEGFVFLVTCDYFLVGIVLFPALYFFCFTYACVTCTQSRNQIFYINTPSDRGNMVKNQFNFTHKFH